MWFLGDKKRIYLDYASATPALHEALLAMREAEALVGNPGAIHTEGVAAHSVLEQARAAIAHELGVKPREVIFTSGLTEANNLGIVGVARSLDKAGRMKGTHWVVSAIEHDAVLESFAEVERLGGGVTHVEPDEHGILSAEKIARAVRPETVMVSVGWANSEIGVVQPLRDIARSVKEKNEKTLIHSDAGQAPLYFSPHVHTLGVDLFSLGSNKLYGPHGVGALYISNRVAASSLIFGGKQERGLRAGTENVALAAGCAAALAVIGKERHDEKNRLRKLRNELCQLLLAKIPGVLINGHHDRVLPHMVNISIPNISSEYVTLSLDQAGIAISTKSACREGENDFSHVVRALGGEEWRAKNTLRLSLGRETTMRDVTKAVAALTKILERNNS